MKNGRLTTLTRRTRKILWYASNGFTHTEAASEMKTTPDAVKRMRRDAIIVMGAENITHAVALAIRRGIIQ